MLLLVIPVPSQSADLAFLRWYVKKTSAYNIGLTWIVWNVFILENKPWDSVYWIYIILWNTSATRLKENIYKMNAVHKKRNRWALVLDQILYCITFFLLVRWLICHVQDSQEDKFLSRVLFQDGAGNILQCESAAPFSLKFTTSYI